MTGPEAFTVATEDRLAQFILAARERLVVVAPALPDAVADAVVERINTLSPEAVALIFDSEPEAYRLGYGTLGAFDRISAAASRSGVAIRRQPGVRIGLVISDSATLVFTPTASLIESPDAQTAANAVLLPGPPRAVESELGLRGEPARMGRSLMGSDEIAALRQDLSANPPQKFDVARIVRVFNAYIEFVDLQVKGAAVGRHLVNIPSHLLAVLPARTRRNLRASCRLVTDGDKLPTKAIANERAVISRRYLKTIEGYGTVVLRKDREAFDKAVDGLRASVSNFAKDVRASLQKQIDQSVNDLEKTLFPALKRKPPEEWRRYGGQPPSEEETRELLLLELRVAFGSAAELAEQMSVTCRIKGVTYELLQDTEFVDKAAKVFPELPRLHEEHDAAKAEAGSQERTD